MDKSVVTRRQRQRLPADKIKANGRISFNVGPIKKIQIESAAESLGLSVSAFAVQAVMRELRRMQRAASLQPT